MDLSKLNDMALEMASEALKLATEKIEEQRERIRQLEAAAIVSRLMPVPTHFSEREGELWQPFPMKVGQSGRVHAIKFEGGKVFDVFNGWRDE